MPYDKKLHLLCGFLITVIIGLYNIYLGLACGITVGVTKELYDEYDYGGFDKYDMFYTWAGAVIGYFIIFVR